MIKYALLLTAALALGIVSGPAPAQQPPVNLHEIEVTLAYNRDDNKIIIETGGTQCPNGEMGCVEVPRNAYLLMKFIIPPRYSNNWFLKRVGVCKGTSSTYPPCGPLRKWERAEFIATKPGVQALLHPDTDGIIELPGRTDTVHLYSMNNIDQSWWYSLQACRRDDPTVCTDLDPQIRNRGRG